MASMTRALGLVKVDPIASLDSLGPVEDLCRQLGHQWRERLLTPLMTLRLFMLQVLHGNTAIAHLRHLSCLDFAPASYCRARMRLPMALFQKLLEITAQVARSAGECSHALGQRVFLVDASSFSMPDTPALAKHLGLPSNQKQGCGFPVAKLLAMIDAVTGMVITALATPLFCHEMGLVSTLHPTLRATDILVGDRAFCSFVHLALLDRQGVFGCFRLPSPRRRGGKRRKKSTGRQRRETRHRSTRRPGRRLGHNDELQIWHKPKDCPAWIDPRIFASLPETLEVRVVRYVVADAGCRTKEVRVATTLIDPQQYCSRQIAQLFGMRWDIELCFRHLKQTMKLCVLKCQTVKGIMKELAVYLLIYNLVRARMLAAAANQRVAVARISFIDAYRQLAAAATGQSSIIPLLINPSRPGRHYARVIKRRNRKYPLMTRPRIPSGGHGLN